MNLEKTHLFADKIRQKNRGFSGLMQSQIIEIETKLSRYLLTNQGDRVSMAHSVEQRFPFLDEDLVDFVLSQPDEFKLRGEKGKFSLRMLMRNKLPSEMMSRKKQGYLAPDRQLLTKLNSKQGRELCSLLSTDDIARTGYFNESKIEELMNKFLNGQLNSYELSIFIFVITTQILHSLFIDQSSILKH